MRIAMLLKQHMQSLFQNKSDGTLSIILIVMGLMIVGVGLLPGHRALKIIVLVALFI